MNKPFIVLISDIKELELFGIKLADYQLKVVNKYWPGPLSVIFDCNKSEFEYLHRGINSLAIRLPKDDWLLDIIRKTGPLVAPSANLQDSPTVKNIDEAIAVFGNSVDFYVDGGICEGSASTLARFKKNKLEVLRLGRLVIEGLDIAGS